MCSYLYRTADPRLDHPNTTQLNFLGTLGAKEEGAGYEAWEIEYSRKLRLGYGAMGAKPALFQIEYEMRDKVTGQMVKVGSKSG